jgi:mannose-6-phosphate isomerase-like protein (cupin superfamily)
MAEPNHTSNVPSNSPDATVEQISPDEQLWPRCPSRESDHVLSVLDGVVYVALEEAEFILTSGDRILIPPRGSYQASNAGDEVAHVATAPASASAGRWLRAA